MKLLSVTEFAQKHNVQPATVRQKIIRGNLPEAFKVGNTWAIPEDAPYNDARVKTGEYKNWRNKRKEQEE